MPSTRKQKAREKRSRQSDVMSDIDNLDLMLGSYQRQNSEIENERNENDVDQRSGGREGISNQVENDYRTYLNTNLIENSSLTVETSRAISSEISSQMSRKLEEIQTNLNSQILDAINSAIEDKVLPSIKIAVKSQNSAINTNLDLRSDGLHLSSSTQARTQKDLQSDGLHSINVSHMAENTQNEFPRLTTAECNQVNHHNENSGDSHQSDDDYGYDMSPFPNASSSVKTLKNSISTL